MKVGILMIFLLVSIISTSGKVIYVPDDYPTIQQAIDSALPKDTIVVRDGVYKENVTINIEHLTVKSESGSKNCTVVSNGRAFKVVANYVNISGFTIKNANEGIHLNANNCSIVNNKISDGYIGIHLYHSNNNSLVNNEVNNNTFGIWCDHSNANRIANNKIAKNEYGVYLSYSNANSLTKNNISLNTWVGIYLYYSYSNSYFDNEVWGNWAGNAVSINRLYFSPIKVN